MRLLQFASLPVSKAELAHEAEEFREAVKRANTKGNKALELLNSCLPDPALVTAWAKDYEVKK
jgi:hypothetical protein